MKQKWRDAYMDTAKRFAELSSATRLKVGAVIVKDHRIISIGYNGTPKGWDNCCEEKEVAWAKGYDPITTSKTKQEVYHAEENAIVKLAASTESGVGSTMFITHQPCMQCAKLIAGSGIRRVYYDQEYRDDAGINFLKKCEIVVKKC